MSVLWDPSAIGIHSPIGRLVNANRLEIQLIFVRLLGATVAPTSWL